MAPGVIGGICLIVALTALSVLPLNYGGLALLLFGIALMVAEAFAPSFGVLGLGGIAAFVLGAFFLFVLFWNGRLIISAIGFCAASRRLSPCWA